MAQKYAPKFRALVHDAKKRVPEMTVDAVKDKIDRGDRFYLIDVREEGEWKKGHLPRATHLCKGLIEREIERTVRDHLETIILYCGAGNRSALAAESIRKMGYINTCYMRGGFADWRDAGYFIES